MPEKGTGVDPRIRVGLINAGKMAMHHARAIGMYHGAVLVAVADPVLRERELHPAFGDGISRYTSADELFREAGPDVVHICTPPETHKALAEMALGHRAHVYVEKPFTLRSAEAVEVLSLAREKGLLVCAGHQLLFESPTLRVDRSLGKIGRLVAIESYFSFNPVRRTQDGKSAISPLDQLVDILPHPVYLLLHFLKKDPRWDEDAVEIRALEVDPMGNVFGILRCGSVVGNLVVTLEGRPIDSYLRITGTNGCILADYVRGAVLELPGPGKSAISKIINPYRQSSQLLTETTAALFRRVFKKQKSYPGLLESITDFYGRISGGKAGEENVSSIIDTVSICERIGDELRMSAREKSNRDEIEWKRKEAAVAPADRSRGSVLVTGGTGLLGKAVAREVRAGNRHTRVVARKIPPFPERIAGVEYVAADLAATIPPGIFDDVSVVVHCAAETAGGKAAHERNSVAATANLLAGAAASNIKRFIHISSIAVLQGSGTTGKAVDENTPLVLEDEDRGPYVWGKAASERLAVQKASESGVEIRVIRPGPLVDFDDFEAPGRLGREVGPLFVYFGVGKSKLSICDVRTAARVVREYVEAFPSVPPVLNLVEPDGPARAQLVSFLLKKRPDLTAVPVPLLLLKAISPGLKLLQRMLRRGQKPVDIYAAFSSERYDATLAADLIRRSAETPSVEYR